MIQIKIQIEQIYMGSHEVLYALTTDDYQEAVNFITEKTKKLEAGDLF